MLYEYYTFYKIAPAEEENNKDAVHEEDNKDKEDDRDDEPPVVGDHGNPYAVFLDNVKDSTTEEEGAGLMGGLKSWLGFAGSMTGTGSTVLSEPMAGKPWLKGGDKVSKYLLQYNWKIINDQSTLIE